MPWPLRAGTSVSARREPVELRELLAGLVGDYPDRPIRFCTSLDAEATYMEGEPVALRRLFANLIDNAMRFGTCCEITLAHCGEHLRVTVDDDGPGIPPGEREAVLEPFYRLEPSRSRATGGSGLGLAIVKQIAEAHGGSVGIAASPAGGTRATIILPAAGVRPTSL